MLVIPDTCVLGVLINPKLTPEVRELRLWMRDHLSRGVRFKVADLSDYELRRNLIVENLVKSLRNLDTLRASLGTVPITTDAFNQAAYLWAQSRNSGKPTGHRFQLDGDAILASQAILESADKELTMIATENDRHLSQFETRTVKVRKWQDI